MNMIYYNFIRPHMALKGKRPLKWRELGLMERINGWDYLIKA